MLHTDHMYGYHSATRARRRCLTPRALFRYKFGKQYPALKDTDLFCVLSVEAIPTLERSKLHLGYRRLFEQAPWLRAAVIVYRGIRILPAVSRLGWTKLRYLHSPLSVCCLVLSPAATRLNRRAHSCSSFGFMQCMVRVRMHPNPLPCPTPLRAEHPLHPN